MRTAPLSEALAIRSEIVHPRDNPTGEATFVGLEHIESGTGRRVGSSPIRLQDLTGRKARFYPRDIVYGYLRPYLNKVWLADMQGYCSVDQYVFRVREGWDPEYIAWFMRSPLFLQLAPITTTPGQLPRIRTDEVLAVPIAFQPLDIQRSIAARLNVQLAAVGRLRRESHQQLAAIEALPASLLRFAFEESTAGID